MATKALHLGRYVASRNGVTLRYRIQTVTPDLAEDVVDHMKYYLQREPLISHDNLLGDPSSYNSYKSLWRNAISNGISLVALEETLSGSPNVIGANVIYVAEKDKVDDKKYEGKIFNRVMNAFKEITNRGEIYEKYGINQYLAAHGLTVHPEYHGCDIGYRLLQCRKPLCKELGITATGTVFTAKVSQHLASKVGFEVLSVEDYQSFEVDGEIAYEDIDGDIRFMGLKFNK
uniref:N-acetyltransferase domain-containing protein n=1 Tax=Triatoma dimidiata TaxID=72491 RepID=A0A0V0G4K4_TRIDM